MSPTPARPAPTEPPSCVPAQTTRPHLAFSLEPQSEEVQALEDQNARELMALQTAADSAAARAAAAESTAAASAAKVASLTQELAAAEAALSAARQEGEEALAALRSQHEADLQQEQQRLREAKGAVRRQEEELTHRIAALEVRGTLVLAAALGLLLLPSLHFVSTSQARQLACWSTDL